MENGLHGPSTRLFCLWWFEVLPVGLPMWYDSFPMQKHGVGLNSTRCIYMKKVIFLEWAFDLIGLSQFQLLEYCGEEWVRYLDGYRGISIWCFTTAGHVWPSVTHCWFRKRHACNHFLTFVRGAIVRNVLAISSRPFVYDSYSWGV